MKQGGQVTIMAVGMEKQGSKEEPLKKNWQDVLKQMGEDDKRDELEDDLILSLGNGKWLCNQQK